MKIGDFTIAGILVSLTAIVWLILDIYLYKKSGEATISEAIRKWSYYSPVIPFIFGFLLGHWLW